MITWTGLITVHQTDLSEQIFINGEPQVQICRVILQNPLERIEIFAVLIKQQTHVRDELHADEQLWQLSCTATQLHSQQTPCPVERFASAASSCRKVE